MADIDLSLQGGRELERDLRAMVNATDNLREPFDEIADDFNRVMAASFAAGGLPRKWKRNRRRNETLVNTGRLRRSLTTVNADNIRQAFNRRLRLGTRVGYAFRHEFGIGNLPRRSMLNAVTPPVRERWAGLILANMTEPWADDATARFTRPTTRRRRRRR